MRQTFILVSITACCAFFTSCQSANDGSQHGAHTDHSSRPLLGVHTLELNEGVSPTQFEAFVSGPFTTLWREPIGGLQVRIQKADRGQDMGRYQAIWAFDSVATRDRYFPDSNTVTDAWHETVGNKIKTVHDQLNKMCSAVAFTDYVVLTETPRPAGVMGASLDGFHSLDLKPGVSEHDFEEFVAGTYSNAWRAPIGGIGRVVMKGERGAQVGKYKVIIRFTPASLRDRYVPSPRTLSMQFTEKEQPMMPKAVEDRIQSMTVRRSFTDFAPVSR